MSRKVYDYLRPVSNDGAIGNNALKEIISEEAYENNREEPILPKLNVKEVSNMDNEKILEKYLDSLNQDKRDMENRLMADRRESEKRIAEERRLSEDRLNKKFDETMQSVNNLNSKMDCIIEKIDNKTDKMNEKIDNNNKYLRNLSISTILGIAALVVATIAMAVTTILALKQIKP